MSRSVDRTSSQLAKLAKAAPTCSVLSSYWLSTVNAPFSKEKLHSESESVPLLVRVIWQNTHFRNIALNSHKNDVINYVMFTKLGFEKYCISLGVELLQICAKQSCCVESIQAIL